MNKRNDIEKNGKNDKKRPFVIKLLYSLFMIASFVFFIGMIIFFLIDTSNLIDTSTFQTPFLIAFIISIVGLSIICAVDFIIHLIKNSDKIKEAYREGFREYKEQFGFAEKAAKEEYKNSLDPIAREKLEEMEWKDRPRKIRRAVAGILAIVIILVCIIGLVIIRNPAEPLFWVCFGGIFAVIISYGIFMSGILSTIRGLRFKNEVAAEGTVHNCKLVMSSVTRTGGQTKYKERYEILIEVENVKNFLKAYYDQRFKIGDKVLVAYDSENPKLCKISQN